MIRYGLVCTCGHEFDAWFSSSASFDEQLAQGLVECPVCASVDVRKQLMTPALATTGSRRKPAAAISEVDDSKARTMRQLVRELHAHVRAHADYVGQQFPDEARRRARQEDARPVWGEATHEDVRALAQEGIEVLPLPPLPQKKN